MPYVPMRDKIEDLNREKTQHRLTQASAATALAAGAMRMSPWAARRSARALTRWKPRTNWGQRAKSRVQWAGGEQGQQRMERAAATTGVTAGLVGGVSTLGFARQQKRSIGEKEKALNLVKAASGSDQWRDYVSPGASRGHTYLHRGERRAYAGATASGLTAAALPAAAVYAARKSPGRTKAAAYTTAGAGSMLLGAQSARQAAKGDRWGSKRRAIERRGRARARGVPDSVPPGDLEELVGKAFVIRPRTAFKSPVGMRRGGFVRRGGKTFYRRGG